MNRQLMLQLREWQKRETHLPLLLRGARQVGKTFLVEQFGKEYFANCIKINFEEEPEYQPCFETLKPVEIINKIEVICQQKIITGQTLLFLDEIQACPQAIIALRYFKEQMPELHIIGAGSLLEFSLEKQGMRMPVGRIQYLYLKPVSFQEYLLASGNEQLLAALEQLEIGKEVNNVIHNKSLKLLQEYMVLGGMPMVIDHYLRNPQAIQECQTYQTVLLKTYSDDFIKYRNTSRHIYLQQVYNRTPGLIGQKIKYVNISNDLDHRYLKQAIYDLSKAGVIFPIYATSATGLPFITHRKGKKFKLLFLDLGLVKRSMKLDMELLLTKDLMLLNRGAIAEQFVGQELLAYQDPYDEPQLYYWDRDKKGSNAEVDYLINIDSKIVPIEVKAGKTGKLKSLHLLLAEKQLPLGIKVSTDKLALHGNILSVPLYMLAQLPRLIKTIIS